MQSQPEEGASPSGDGSSSQPKSYGPMGEHHWSRARKDKNAEALGHLRARSRAPGVAEGGAERNHYCMRCNGVIPLAYDQREPASADAGTCPHCGVELDARVRAMFNWVEIDQPPRQDRALAIALVSLIVLVVALLVWWW
jgi:hypothetical protein